jgi:hypothetical protein
LRQSLRRHGSAEEKIRGLADQPALVTRAL